MPLRIERLSLVKMMLIAAAFQMMSATWGYAQSVGLDAELATHSRSAEFRGLDRNSDGLLTESEFMAGKWREVALLRRDFNVFDVNCDGRMSLEEFLTVPLGQPEHQRRGINDSVFLMSEQKFVELSGLWTTWDRNDDDLLSAGEFSKSAIRSRVPGLQATQFSDWDLNGEGSVSLDEVRRILNAAYGVCGLQGELYRTDAGNIVDYRLFRQLRKDENGFVNREDYYQALGPIDLKEKERWLNSVDHNRDGKFNFGEFCLSPHRTNSLEAFLDLDADLDGRLNVDEIDRLPGDRFPVTKYLFPGFDENRDGVLSLREFQLTPVINLLTSWHLAKDKNNDGLLNFEEFRTLPGLELAALDAEYFRRLDLNQDHSLSLDEFPFTTSHISATESEIRAMWVNGRTKIIKIPNYPIVHSPEISPDAKWVAVDGWKADQTNVAAHVFVCSLVSNEIRDLGVACIPHWSPDGRQIGYSKYGKGVFIRDFEGAGNEVSIDPQGWSIHFAPDGLKVAYVTNGNFVIYDLATKEKRLVFPPNARPYPYIEHNYSWSPDSKRICFRGYRNNPKSVDVCIVSVTGDDPNLRIQEGLLVVGDFAWRLDGKGVLFPKPPTGPEYQQIYTFDPDEAKPLIRFPRQPANRNNGGQSMSRDGTIVFMSRH